MRSMVFDTETTNLIQASEIDDIFQPAITEFYANVIDENGEVVDELEFMCNPMKPIDRKASEITGLTNEMLKSLPPFSHFEESVRNLLEKSDELVAHNLKFDIGMLNLEFRRCKKIDIVKWPELLICTVEQTEWIMGHRLKEGDLYEYLFNERFVGAHRAKADVKALTKCFIELRNREFI